jgi:GT2 family glycosyltransferase
MSCLAISTIVVNYNAGDWLTRCVSSLLAEQVDEVLVVDNGSVDASLQALADQFSPQLTSGQLKLLPQSSNLGFSKACNIGAEAARNPHLLFLNPDSSVHAGSLNTLLNTYKENPRFGLVGGRIFNTDGTEQGQAKRGFPALGLFKPKPLGLPSFTGFEATSADAVYPVQAISGSCMLIGKELFCQIGGFDERYTLHCEDLDLCIKVHREDLGVGYVESAHFTHAKGACSTKNPLWVEWQKHKSMLYFYVKHVGLVYNPVDLMIVLPGLITHMVWVWVKIKILKTY